MHESDVFVVDTPERLEYVITSISMIESIAIPGSITSVLVSCSRFDLIE